MRTFENHRTRICVEVHSRLGVIDTLILVGISRGDHDHAVALFKEVCRQYEGRPLREWHGVYHEKVGRARRRVFAGLLVCAAATVIATVTAMEGAWLGWGASGVLFLFAAWCVIRGLRVHERREHA